jgi:hypothetical protein
MRRSPRVPWHGRDIHDSRWRVHLLLVRCDRSVSGRFRFVHRCTNDTRSYPQPLPIVSMRVRNQGVDLWSAYHRSVIFFYPYLRCMASTAWSRRETMRTLRRSRSSGGAPKLSCRGPKTNRRDDRQTRHCSGGRTLSTLAWLPGSSGRQIPSSVVAELHLDSLSSPANPRLYAIALSALGGFASASSGRHPLASTQPERPDQAEA